MAGSKKYAIHVTRTYFITALDEDEALDLFADGAYEDKSDEDVDVQEWHD